MQSDSVCAALFEGGSPGSWRGALWGLNKLSAIWTDTRSIFQCHWVLIELLKWLKTIRWSLPTLSVEPLSGYRFIFLTKTSREKIARLRPKMQDRMVLPGLLGSSVHEQTLVACHLIQSLLDLSTHSSMAWLWLHTVNGLCEDNMNVGSTHESWQMHCSKHLHSNAQSYR